ncbi:signal peptidase I [Deinococcus lacus]|uniref:Signal peptidase I n=1 Tax=Deinococcus lacus TaxID=392561 RepID=A0ABW1Y911_9DEIO
MQEVEPSVAPAPRRQPSPLERLWKELLEPVVFAVLVTQFLVTMVSVDGVSMMPNLRNGERVFLPKYETWLHKAGIGQFHRGDIVVFKPPRAAAAISPHLTKDFLGLWTYRPFLIKRVIGVPGDRVRVSGGEVYVNGQLLDSGWTTNYWLEQGCWDTVSPVANQAAVSAEGILEDRAEVTVPQGHYYVMGDNRTEGGSEDSRLFGAVPLRDIAGRAAAVIWPIMQKQNLSYDCAMRQAGEGSGENELAWRSLTRPEAFSKLGQ